jgi:hypothetical protein
MNIVQVRLFRLALSSATTVSVAAVIIFYASGEDKDLEARTDRAAHDKAIFARVLLKPNVSSTKRQSLILRAWSSQTGILKRERPSEDPRRPERL